MAIDQRGVGGGGVGALHNYFNRSIALADEWDDDRRMDRRRRTVDSAIHQRVFTARRDLRRLRAAPAVGPRNLMQFKNIMAPVTGAARARVSSGGHWIRDYTMAS